MPQFYFQIVDGDFVPDNDGIELPNLAAACRIATDILAERLKGSGEEVWKARRWELEITDAAGTVLAMLAVNAELLV